MRNCLRSIKINVFYDKNVGKITGKNFEEAIISENLNFINFLNFIFSSYPEIQKRFIPGILGFLLNGKVPKENDILRNGDKLEIMVIEIKDIRKKIESQILEIINYYQIDITFKKIKEMIFKEERQEDFNKLVEIFASKIDSSNVDKINEVLKIVNAVWNYFPHKSLKGLSPMEKLEIQ